MKRVLRFSLGCLYAAGAAAFLLTEAGAQTTSNAETNSAALSQAGSQSAVIIDQSTTFAEGSQRSGGTSTIKTAPDVVAPSLGSGHPCMINTSVGISVIGGGASGGQGTVDYGCMMMRSSNAQDNLAGRYYYAAKDVDACKAWRSAGAIPSGSLCGVKEVKAAQKAATSTSTKSPKPLFSKCLRRSDGKISIKYTSAGKQNIQAAQQQCAATLR